MFCTARFCCWQPLTFARRQRKCTSREGKSNQCWKTLRTISQRTESVTNSAPTPLPSSAWPRRCRILQFGIDAAQALEPVPGLFLLLGADKQRMACHQRLLQKAAAALSLVKRMRDRSERLRGRLQSSDLVYNAYNGPLWLYRYARRHSAVRQGLSPIRGIESSHRALACRCDPKA